MQLVQKTIKGRKYWYAVRKGRRGKTVTNVETVYLGSTDKLLARLGLGSGEGGTSGDESALLPVGYWSEEVGGSTALWGLAQSLGVVGIIDECCGTRRSDAVLSYGEILVILAIQRAIAPSNRKSLRQLPNWYESCRIRRFVDAEAHALDERAVHKALGAIDAATIERMEDAIVGQVIAAEGIDTGSLAFDATNFDSYAASTTSSQLLRRGHAKSKKKNLRVLGLGLLVSSDDGVPLLSFTYPGNRADVASFKSFLRRLRRRTRSLALDENTTVACDGGNISRETVELLEEAGFRFVARLPTGHAPEADALKSSALRTVRGLAGRRMAAKSLNTEVYGKKRRVIAVFSESMKESQLPGLERDINKAKEDIQALRQRLERQAAGSKRSPLDIPAATCRVRECLKRQHMASLFKVEVSGDNAAPVLNWEFDQGVFDDLVTNKLGRTAVITDHPSSSWSDARTIKALSEQSHAEDAFRQMKDPRWASAVPLRCRRDQMLRIHAFISVLALLLASLLRRRLGLKGVHVSIDELLFELSELRCGYLKYRPDAPGGLRELARSRAVPPCPTPAQREIVRSLKLDIELGPTRRDQKRGEAQ